MVLRAQLVLFVLLPFWATLAAAQPAGERGGSPPRLSPEELIRQFDRNGDGKISRDEAPPRMLSRWDQLDTNHDGFITLDELQTRDARVAGLPNAAGMESRFKPSAKFSVITVGTGSPQYDPKRSGPSALIQYQGRCFLVDMGNGTQAKLAEAGITFRQIDALLLTHHHLDHNEEFTPLFMHTRLAGGKPEIIGPPGTAKLVDFIKSFYAEDLNYRLRRMGRTMADFAPAAVREVKGGESFVLGPLHVSTVKVNHSIYTVAYRFDADGQSIVISGDLYYTKGLVELAHNADVLVIDSGGAIVRKGVPARAAVGGEASFRQARDEAEGIRAHSTSQEVVRMATESGAKHIVLTHIAPGDVDEEATARAIAEAGYKGQVTVGHDLLEIVPAAPVAAAAPQASARAAGQGHVYVSIANATGKHDGQSWATAFSSIQGGIDAAARQGGEVWVARGTYKPTNGTDRSISFQLRKGVAVYGGFAGAEAQLDQRNWEKNPTILSGDIGKEGVKTDNSYRVVLGADDAILDGFTITGGYSLDAGPGGPGNTGGPGRMGPPGDGPPMGGPLGPRGGGRPFGGPPTGGGAMGGGPPGQGPIHTTPDAILRGASPGFGAGMSNYQCAPTIRNCTFSDNHAGKGGAMYNMSSRSFPPRRDAAAPAPTIINCRFINNSARARGGAVANDLGTSPTLRGCTFIGNSCEGKGGAIYDDFGCSPTLVNCLFAENRSISAGAIGNDGGSSPLVVHCTFTRNLAQEEGAALYQGTGPANNPTVVGCILWDDHCDSGPAEIYNWHDDDPQVGDCCIQGGYRGQGNFDKDPRFVDPAHGDYRLQPDSPCKEIGHAAATSDQLLKELAAQTPPPMRPRPDFGQTPRPPAPPGNARTLFVNAANAAGRQDGASWATAYSSLAAALKAASGQRAELWIAAGTYKPTTTTDRSAAFVLHDGIEIYGGFSGRETQRQQRNWTANPTILSGDIGRPGDASDNVYHVIIGANDAILDGLTIRDGNADGPTYDGKGGGMVNYARAWQSGPMGPATGFSPVLRNCTFTHNRAREGGAVYSYDRGHPEYSNCRFAENEADYGGAIVDRVGVRSVFTDCAFENNKSRWKAGAIYLDYGARPQLTNCRFAGNHADASGGALAMVSRASQLEATIPLLKSCAFAANSAGQRGGAIANADSCTLGLDACTFSDNRAPTGSAISTDYRAKTVLIDCDFKPNGATDIATDATSTLTRSRADWPSGR